MKEVITSVQNPLIKRIKRLSEKAAARKEEQRFIIEGIRECSLLQQSAYGIEMLIICEEIFTPSSDYPIAPTEHIKYVSKQVYEAIAYRGSSEGIMALAIPHHFRLHEIALRTNPLLLVIAAVEKPGNLGAMLRTADATGVDAVIICDEKTDIFNPNVIRSSLGTFFTNNVIVASWDKTAAFFKANNITSFAAHLNATKNCYECNFTNGTAIVVGSEATGLNQAITDTCSEHLKIPMLGKIDSLNVSVSAAVLLYEAVRQRTKKVGA